ncbi:MAG: HPr kinase/phosphorylase [Parvularculaceae bacterium]
MVLPGATLIHASAIGLAVDRDGPLAGVLILGPSGAGKTSLALAAIESCLFRRTILVADDQVAVGPGGEAAAPQSLQGLIEVRGFGPARVPYAPSAKLVVAVDLGAEAGRVPKRGQRAIARGVSLPIFPFRWAGAEATATHRLRVMVRQVLCGQIGEDPQDARP